jgi:transmembrane sensor
MHSDPSSSGDQGRREAAIDWLSRIRTGAMTRTDRDAFDAWLSADEANRAAFEKAFAVWRDLKGVSIPAVAAPPRRQRWRLAAASLAAMLLLFYFASDLIILWRADFSTDVGELRTVTLEDGSRIELNADTAIAKHYSGGRRRLTLLKGEAWFAVASDPARPFVVEAAGGTTTALGTSFDIAMSAGGAQVSVTEHKVIVAAAGGTAIVEQGQQLSYHPDLPALAAHPADVEDEAAWRRGYLIFHDKPLSDVVAAINRHFHGHVLIMTPSIRDRKINGLFRTSDPLESIRAIELSLGIRATYLGNYLVVLWG